MANAQSRWRKVAIVLFVAAFVVTALATLTKPWPASDYWVHLAVVRTLAEGGRLEDIPLGQSPGYFQRHYDPHHVLWGVVMRHTGLRGSDVMAMAGVLNLAIFLGGLAFLCRCLSRAWTFPACLLVVMLVFWGQGYDWSNEYHLSVLPRVAPYPSTLAWGLSFIVFGLVHSWSRRGGGARLCAAALIGGLTVAVHGLTALMFTLSFPVLWVWMQQTGWRRRWAVCIYPVACLFLSLVWPHNWIIQQVRTALAGWTAGPHATVVSAGFLWPERMLVALGPILAGFFFLALAPRRWRRQLVAGAVAYSVLWVGGSCLGVPLAHRFAFFLIFVLHLTVAVSVARGFRIWTRRGKASARAAFPVGLAAAAVLLIPWAPYHAFRIVEICRQRVDIEARALRPSSLGLYEHACQDLVRSLPEGATIIADRRTAKRLPAFGLPVVQGGGMEERHLKVPGPDFLAAVQRSADSHGATHVVVDLEALAPTAGAFLESLGSVKTLAPHLTLVELRRPHLAPS